LLEVHENAPPPGWDSAIEEGGGLIFHTEAWARHKCHNAAGEPLFFVWREAGAGEVVGRALATRRPPSSTWAGRLVGRLVFDAAPLSAVAGVDFAAPVGRWAKRQRALVEVALGSFDSPGSWAPREVPGAAPRLEYVLPLGDEEAFKAGVRRLVRRKVKRAAETGVEVRRTRDEEARARVHSPLGAKQRAPLRDEGAAGGRRRPRRLRRLAARAACGGSGAGSTWPSPRRAHRPAGCSPPIPAGRTPSIRERPTRRATRARRSSPSSARFEELRGEGVPQANLGGAPADAGEPESPDHGLHQFKTRFGAEPVRRVSGCLVPRPLRARLVQKAQRLASR
jgi:hypothetical protein